MPALYASCETARITYTPGLPTNARLTALAAPLQAEAERQYAATGAKVRLLGETIYLAESWPYPRRVVIKAERLAKGLNTRFVVTTRSGTPTNVYGCFADRLSCHRFWAN